MAVVKILAPLTGGARDAVVLASAFAAAKPFHAHVVALFIRPDPTEAMPFFGEGVSGAVVQEIVDAAREAADEASTEARKTVQSEASRAEVRVVDGPMVADAVTVSFSDVQGNFADRVTHAARLADLIVFGPLSESDKPGLAEAFEAALLETGRPVLLTAQALRRDFMRRVIVGWDASITSSRAVTAALPFLTAADSVEVLTVKEGDEPGPSCADVCEYLKLHGVRATSRVADAGGRAIADALLAEAAVGGAGLLVIGGYGHGRLREIFFGGVTKQVVSDAELPLFLVH